MFFFCLNSIPVDAFLKSLCADPRIDCYDLMTALTGLTLCPNIYFDQ